MTNAGLLRRMGAIFYDSMLLLALMFFATLPFVAVRGGEPVGPGAAESGHLRDDDVVSIEVGDEGVPDRRCLGNAVDEYGRHQRRIWPMRRKT